MFITLPETSSANILLRRAKRLRKLTGNQHLISQSEIDQKHMTAHDITYEALVEPWKINALDPAVLYSTFYTALVYAIYYSFFESVPLVYTKIYHFNLGETVWHSFQS
jgi:DHA1 family multidrug resistance protein-like MFS transporter